MLQKQITEDYNITLNFSDILLSDEDEENLTTLMDVNTACLNFFEQEIQYLIYQPLRSLNYTDILGFCNRHEIDPEKYSSLYSKKANGIPLDTKVKKELCLMSIIWLIIKKALSFY